MYEKDYLLMDRLLWDVFCEDFEDFNATTFAKASTATTGRLKKVLQSRGVYVQPHGKKMTIANSLIACRDSEYHLWDSCDIQEALDQGINFQSKLLVQKAAAINPSSISTAAGNTPFGTSAQPESPRPELLEPLPPSPVSASRSPSPAAALPRSYGREIANLAKMYTDQLRYGAEGDSFSYKLRIFYDMCNRADVPQEAYLKAFLTMLKGLPLNQFFNSMASKAYSNSFQDTIKHMSSFFEGPGFQRRALGEWDSIKLSVIIRENQDKPINDCLTLLINKLQTI